MLLCASSLDPSSVALFSFILPHVVHVPASLKVFSPLSHLSALFSHWWFLDLQLLAIKNVSKRQSAQRSVSTGPPQAERSVSPGAHHHPQGGGDHSGRTWLFGDRR